MHCPKSSPFPPPPGGGGACRIAPQNTSRSSTKIISSWTPRDGVCPAARARSCSLTFSAATKSWPYLAVIPQLDDRYGHGLVPHRIDDIVLRFARRILLEGGKPHVSVFPGAVDTCENGHTGTKWRSCPRMRLGLLTVAQLVRRPDITRPFRAWQRIDAVRHCIHTRLAPERARCRIIHLEPAHPRGISPRAPQAAQRRRATSRTRLAQCSADLPRSKAAQTSARTLTVCWARRTIAERNSQATDEMDRLRSPRVCEQRKGSAGRSR